MQWKYYFHTKVLCKVLCEESNKVTNGVWDVFLLRYKWGFYYIMTIFIYTFRHNEITVYIVGIILMFMTYILILHWYGINFQVNICQRVDWSATSHTHANTADQRKWYFPWYPICYYTVSPFTFFGNWLWKTRVKFTCIPSHATKGYYDQWGE